MTFSTSVLHSSALKSNCYISFQSFVSFHYIFPQDKDAHALSVFRAPCHQPGLHVAIVNIVSLYLPHQGVQHYSELCFLSLQVTHFSQTGAVCLYKFVMTLLAEKNKDVKYLRVKKQAL